MRLLKLFPGLVLSITIVACGGSSSSAPSKSTTPAPSSAAASDPSCPVAVAGTSVTVEDAPNGASLVFVTTGDVTDVRRRAAAMASMHNEHHSAMGPLPDGASAGGGHEGHDMSGGDGSADAHAGHGAGGHAGHDMKGGAHAGHAGGMIGVHSKAAASDVEGGAKITFVVGAADVAKLQSELRMHAQHMSAGTCSMGSS